MSPKRYIPKKGDLVKVQVEDTEGKKNSMLIKYNGKIMCISRVIKFNKAAGNICELEGARSKYDIAYWFDSAWLTPVPAVE